jgi:crotonobetainyl-CoA:carnitine CoA-transferase CaiB-like acyl-CoA transferase
LATALHYRERTGEGQYIDLSMCEVVTSMLPEAMMEFFINGRDLEAIGNRDREMAPHGVYPASGEDNWLAIACVDDADFAALCDELGCPAMAQDQTYATLEGRLRHVAELDREIATATRKFDREALAGRLRGRGLSATAAYSTGALIHDPAFAASGMMVPLNHKECGERPTPTLPVRFSSITPDYRPAPLAGEHTGAILTELLGYSDDEIARLKLDKVIL